MQSSPLLQARQNKRLGHVPPKGSFWDLEISSNSESGEEEEVEEVLLPPLDSEPSLDPRAPFPRRASLLLTGEVGDDLPGAKARKLMGYSTESWFEDSDDDDQDDSSSSVSHTLSRSGSINFRNPFKRSNSLLRESSGLARREGGWQHRRGASLGGEESSTDLARDRAPKRTMSFSNILSGVTSSGRTSPLSSYSPQPKASPSPNTSSRNLLRFKSTRPSTMHNNKPFSSSAEEDVPESDVDDEWSQTLDQAAKAAKWQTAIEHRPKQRYSCTSATRQDSINSEPVSPQRFGDFTGSLSSPASTHRLSQMTRFTFEHQTHSTWDKAAPTPPRPPKSLLRGQEPTRRTRDLYNDSKDEVSIRYQDGFSNSAIVVPFRRRSNSQRQSTVSSGFSSEAPTPQGFCSPGLSASSSTTQSSNNTTDILPSSVIKTDDMDRNNLMNYSPFLRPRKAPKPPHTEMEPMEGLGLTLGEWIPERIDNSLTDHICHSRPIITRQESSTDPIMLRRNNEEEEEEEEEQQQQQQQSYPNRSDRPTSVPFSPPSAYSVDLSDYEDDFLATLDRLDSNLGLTSHDSIPSEKEWKLVDIPFRFNNVQSRTSDQFKGSSPSHRNSTTLVKSSPSPSTMKLLPATPCESPAAFTGNFSGWLRYTEQEIDSPVQVKDLRM